ncbi:hypothetical protein [Acuticoccus kandeliae]|uniref:hypothetical protein n=1 Tax=Acuticoccus kandeliae TaxID=2073160 RepID=UPI00130031F0|nr:hypothetical protein [Acuticoccus kandeliae]
MVALIASEKSGDRLFGAYCLRELGREVESLTPIVVQLADDIIPDCRRSFVEYVGSAGIYDEPVANGLATCMLDLNLYVRVSVIRWGARTSEERFKDFLRSVQVRSTNQELRFKNPLSNEFWQSGGAPIAR